MFRVISDREIHLTRGDSALIDLTIQNADGSPYEVQPDDVIEFSVKKTPTPHASDPLIHKVGIPFKLEPEDTRDLEYGRYAFDVQITQGNGDVSTIIAYEPDNPTVFKILPEVTL